LQVPKSYIDEYRREFGDEEPYIGDKGYFPHRYPHAAYAAMVTYLDDQVGEIVAKLKELGLYENTIIMFTSDNGPTYVGGADSEFFDSAKPFKSAVWKRERVYLRGRYPDPADRKLGRQNSPWIQQ
jgi:arylsulfatase A-like enzyme